MTDLEQYLHSYFTFDQNDLVKVSMFFKKVTINKGDYFLKVGKVCNKLCFIQSGLLRIYVDLDGKEVTQWISSKGILLLIFPVSFSKLRLDTICRH